MVGEGKVLVCIERQLEEYNSENHVPQKKKKKKPTAAVSDITR